MKRRTFIRNTSLASLGSAILGVPDGLPGQGIQTASDMQDYLRSLHEVAEPSVDRIVIGDPATRIRKIGTCWQPYFHTLRRAKHLGINLMIVHEPTFYTHWDLDTTPGLFHTSPDPAREKYLEAIEAKKAWIEENDMVIIRSHDVPDILKDFGIPFALGFALGFENDSLIGSRDYYNVYRITQDKARNVAVKIAESLRAFNQPGVAFYGDPERMVTSVGLGTGCICDPMQYQELEPELSIAIDDTVRTWTHTSFAEDTGDPLVVINHGTSEEMGMKMLNQFLARNIPEQEFIHLNQGCTYRWITGT